MGIRKIDARDFFIPLARGFLHEWRKCVGIETNDGVERT